MSGGEGKQEKRDLCQNIVCNADLKSNCRHYLRLLLGLVAAKSQLIISLGFFMVDHWELTAPGSGRPSPISELPPPPQHPARLRRGSRVSSTTVIPPLLPVFAKVEFVTWDPALGVFLALSSAFAIICCDKSKNNSSIP